MTVKDSMMKSSFNFKLWLSLILVNLQAFTINGSGKWQVLFLVKLQAFIMNSCYYKCCYELKKKIWSNRNFHSFSMMKNLQKQPPRDVLRRRCSESMQQIYRRTPMLICDFNIMALQLYWNGTSTWVFSRKFAAYFQNIFS